MTDHQSAVEEKGFTIFKLMEEEGKSIFNKDWWYGKVMDWSMQNEQFKTQMFRFVDVLPSLQSSSEVTRHLKEYFAEGGKQIPSIFNFGLGVGSFAPGLVSAAVVKNVTQMAKMFIAGETPKDAIPNLVKARKSKIGFTVDILGEATLSEKEARQYQSKYLELIDWLSEEAKGWGGIPQIDEDALGSIPRVNVSVKLSSLYSQIKETSWQQTVETLKERLRPLFRRAMQKGVFINLDMEQYSLKNLTLDVFEQILIEDEFKDYRFWGIVIQAYLTDSYADIERLVAFAKRRKTPFTVRLVKGAYWEYETIQARQKGWPVPVYLNKWETDANYERCSMLLLENYPNLFVALGSHNVRSISNAIVFAEKRGLDMRSFEIQMLYGMADPIKKSLVKQGYRLREYSPVGELVPGMAYLVRRLLENTSNESFLRSKFAENLDPAKLLADPTQRTETETTMNAKPAYEFQNHPPLDFTLSDSRNKVEEAIHKRKQRTSADIIPVVINNASERTQKTMLRSNPSHPQEKVAEFCLANEELAQKAIEGARKAFLSWARVPGSARADLLDKVADLFVRDRFDLIALEIAEVGKGWVEADGDVTEAIDFCRYYAKEMRRLHAPRTVGHAPGELSLYHYQPRGVAAVISPWNFPLAILTGQVAAALVTGNTVIMKPAEQSTAIAFRLMQLLIEAGLPPGAVQFVPGLGEEVGRYLTSHRDIDLIAFTGSKAVGLEILRKAAEVHPGQKNVKKCIVEMGGKNAIIIDLDADLDEAIAGVVYSAFGFQGQKCSACSRVIVLDSVYDRFVERLFEAVVSLKVGAAEDPSAFVGPVVDEEAKIRLLAAIEQGKKEASLLYESPVPSEGHFVPITVFKDVLPQSFLAQTELFGPVLSIIKAKDLDEALRIANDVEYALTGGFYSRSPANIERVKSEFEVGNLYINRGITGALVERHPFGGFKMSGVGSKTGGPDYLTQFMEPRCVTENTLRRGFAPEI